MQSQETVRYSTVQYKSRVFSPVRRSLFAALFQDGSELPKLLFLGFDKKGYRLHLSIDSRVQGAKSTIGFVLN